MYGGSGAAPSRSMAASGSSASNVTIRPPRCDEETSAPDARLVDDEEITGPQEPGQLAEGAILEPALGREDKQSRCVAFCQRLLRDPLRGERVVEVGGPQRSKSAVCASAAPGAPAGTDRPRCWYAAAVASRQRSVRASRPRRIRKGSTTSSIVSGSSWTLTA